MPFPACRGEVVATNILPGSPEWWLRELDKELDERAGRIEVYDDYYYSGRHPLAFASDRFRKTFGGLFREFADNWCELVVDAVADFGPRGANRA